MLDQHYILSTTAFRSMQKAYQKRKWIAGRSNLLKIKGES